MASRFWVGGSGTWDASSTANWSATTGGAAGASAPTNADNVFFNANSGTAATITVTATAVSLNTEFNKSDINITLSGSPTLCTSAGQLTLTSGTLTLNTFTLTIGLFNTSNTNARTIAFGTGNITLIGNATRIWDLGNATNFTYTGTSAVNCTYSGSTGTRTIQNAVTAGGSQSIAISFNITAGSDIVTISGRAYINNLNFTGFTGTYSNNLMNLYGNLIISSGMTLTAGANTLSIASTSNNQQITSNSKTLDFPINFTSSVTTELQDNLTIGITRTSTLTLGTLDLKNNTLSTGLFNSSNTSTRAITFGTGNITTTGSGTVWNTASTTGFSYTGTPTVNISNNSATATTVSTGALTEAKALNFNYTVGTYTLTDTAAVYKSVNFTGFTGTIPNSVRTIYGGATFVAGMTLTAGANATTFAATSGTNNITTAQTLDFPIVIWGLGGTFAFQDALTQGATRAFTITAGTVQLKAATTNTVGSFVATNSTMKYLQSTTPGTQATISDASGTNTVSYLTIQDSIANGGATWLAYTDQGNIDAGNVDGWDFGISPVVGGAEYTYVLRSFTTPRRF